MSPNYYKRKHAKQIAKSRKGVVARERNRLARATECGTWQRVKTVILIVTASPDGKHIGLAAVNSPQWYRCGSERAVTAAARKLIWGSAPK
jgi:hypothetical protein